MYDTAFRHMAACNISAPWSKVNEQLYNDILKEETVPYCISCHSYGPRTLASTVRSKSNQPFCSSTAYSLPSLTNALKVVPVPPTSPLDPDRSSYLSSITTSTVAFATTQTVNISTSTTSKTVEATILVCSALKETDSIITT